MSSSPCNCPQTTTTPNPAAEPLDSALQNFISAMFGTVTKTEVDGSIVWTLPCDLATGIPGNPIEPGEGLACYFKRLFEDGLTGLQGDPGNDGNDGAPGANAFTTLASDVALPASDVVSVNLPLVSADWTAVGAHLFVAGLGWVRVDGIAGDTVAGTIISRIASPVDPIPAGAAVVAAGSRGPTGASAFPPTTSLSMAGYKLTNVGNPTDGADAANKTYVDTVAASNKWLLGPGAPASGAGVVGYFYADTDAGTVYRKTGAATWEVKPFLSTGLYGGGAVLRGAGAPAGVLGQVKDWYVDDTGAVYLKTGATTWAAGVWRATTSQNFALTGNASGGGFAIVNHVRHVHEVPDSYYVVTADDIGGRIVCSASLTATTTIEFTGAVFKDGAEVEIVQTGDDPVEVYVDPGDTLITSVHAHHSGAHPGLWATAGKYSVISVRRIGDTLIVAGDYV